jgi:hypothetical protein
MERIACLVLTVFLFVGFGQPCQATEIPFRSLSLPEARMMALAHIQAFDFSNHAPGFGEMGLDEETPLLQSLLHLTPAWGRAEMKHRRFRQLLEVEAAYWDLSGSWWTLQAREQALRLAKETHHQLERDLNPGNGKAAALEQVHTQCEVYRIQCRKARDEVRENDARLRAVVGLDRDGPLLMPIDEPVFRPCKLDWEQSCREALSRNNELRLRRLEVSAALLQVQIEEAIGSGWLGPVAPLLKLLGFRAIDFDVRAQEAARNVWRVVGEPLQPSDRALARRYQLLKHQELRIERLLGLNFRRIHLAQELVPVYQEEREAFAEQLRNHRQQLRAGCGNLALLLETQRSWVESLVKERNAIVQFNGALNQLAALKDLDESELSGYEYNNSPQRQK